MKEIRTIVCVVGSSDKFDQKVNALLCEGYTLTTRRILEPYEGPTRYWERCLYAELEREVEEPHGDR